MKRIFVINDLRTKIVYNEMLWVFKLKIYKDYNIGTVKLYDELRKKFKYQRVILKEINGMYQVIGGEEWLIKQ